jgi:hypothetical protein
MIYINALGAKTLRRAVTLLPFGITAEYLYQLRIVNVLSERVRDGQQVHLMAVRGQLDSVRQSAFNIPKKLRCTPGIPQSNHPGNNQFGLCFNRGERPNVAANPSVHLLCGHVLLLAANEAPNLIDLNPLSGNVTDNAVLVFGAGVTDANQQAKNRSFRYARHTGCRASRASLDQRRDNRYFLRHAHYVCHGSRIRKRFRIVNRKVMNGPVSDRCVNFRPSHFGGLPGAPRTLFIGHGFEPTLTPDLAALGPHLSHDLLNDSNVSGFRSFQKNPAGVLNRVKFFSCACALWHMPQAWHETEGPSRDANFK